MNRDDARGRRPRSGRGRGSWSRVQGRGNPQDASHSQQHRYSNQLGAGIHGPSANDFSGNKSGSSTGEMGSPQDMFPYSSSKYPEHKPARGSEYRREWRPSERKEALSHAEKLKEGRNSTNFVEVNPKEVNCSVASDSGHEGNVSSLSRPKEAKCSVASDSLLSTPNFPQNLRKGVEGLSSSKYPEHKPARGSEYRREWRPSERKEALSHAEKLKEGRNSTNFVEVNPKEVNCSVASDSGHEGNVSSLSRPKEAKCSVASDSLLSTPNFPQNLRKGVEGLQIRENCSKMTGNGNSYMPSNSEAKDKHFPINSPISTFGHQKPELSEHKTVDSPFDLCPPKAGGGVKLKEPLHVQNRERRNEMKHSTEQPSEIVLQSGMVLLKRYISISDQIKIVKLCRELGLGPGGFYRPGYRDGAKLNLMMMCFGKNWDPETGKYGDHRPHDGAKPPSIPIDFVRWVESAIKDSHSLISKTSKASKSEAILPPVIPDICIVNFYSSTGRLGLHQDRDESEQSLRKGLPVVSFSIGDAAEFLYGDQRDVELAKKVTLESGDVLIFGGKSRHVFHGVASIMPNTAPKTLEATNIQAGRLNLTFRQY